MLIPGKLTTHTLFAMNILIIDDDAEDTEIFCHALKEVAPDINCLVVNDPKTGIGYLKDNSQPPYAIFLDANMVLINGRECLIELRKIQKLKDTRIIMYSGYMSDKQIEEYRKLGADEMWSKPSSYDGLRKALSDFFVSRS
jgi:CheY-like chemotaxis protein